MRNFLPVALILLLGLTAWLFLSESPEEPQKEGVKSALTAEQPQATNSLENLPPEKASSDSLQRTTSPSRRSSWDEDLRWGAPLAPAADGFTLEVVTAASEEPVPAAVIQLIPERQEVRAGDPEIPDEEEDFSAYWLREAESWRTDETGQLQVPAAWRGRTVIARSETEFAVQRLDADATATRFTIRLAPARNTLVRVIDAQDRPVAGVEVGLYRQVNQNFSRHLSAVTDTTGLARFFQVLDPGLGSRGMNRWRFAVATQLGEVRTEPMPRADLPTELTLQIGTAARLHIELQEEDGSPARRPLEVILTTVEQREHQQRANGQYLGMFGATTADANLDMIGLPANNELVLLCDFARQVGWQRRWQELRIPALTSGEERTVVFRASGDRPTLAFLVLDPQGKPLRETELHAELRREESHTSYLPETLKVMTDTEGRFLWTLAQGPMRTETREFIGRSLRLAYDLAKPRARWQTTLDLGRDFPGSPAEDLVVRLRDLPLTAGGWVRRPDGKRLARVTVQLEGTPQEEVVDGVRQIKSARRLASTSTDQDGRFWLYGEDTASLTNLTLEARNPSGQDVTMPVALGSDQHDLVLDSGGILIGTVHRPRALPDLAITTAFHFPHPENPDWDNWATDSIDRQGHFRFGGLPDDAEGTLKFALGNGYPGEIVHTLESVRPWREGMNPDPRLQDIDLEGLVRAFEVVALNHDGEVMPEARFLQITETNGGYSWRTLSSPEGRVSLYGGQEPVELRIQAKGHYDAVVTLVEGLNEVRMEAAPTVVFHLDRMPELPPHRSLRLDLDPINGAGFFQLAESEIGDDGTLSTTAPPAGSYQVSIDLVTNTEGGWSSSGHELKLPDGSPYTIVIGRGEGQRFEIIVPEDFYENIIK